MCAHDDIYLNGDCRVCDREKSARYRKRVRLAVSLLHSAESRGLTGLQALSLIQNADPATIDERQTKSGR